MGRPKGERDGAEGKEDKKKSAQVLREPQKLLAVEKWRATMVRIYRNRYSA